VRDTTLYSLTLLTDLFGPVKQIVGASNRRQRAVSTAAAADDNTLLTLELAEGVLAVATGSYAVAGRLVPAGFLGIYGAQGSIETVQVDPVTWLPTQVEIRTRDPHGQISSRVRDCPLSGVPRLGGRHARLPEAQVHADIMHLVQCILSDTVPLATVEQARHLVEVIEKAAAAAQTGLRQCIESRFPFPRKEC
jgi:predicted dehydrogenase